MSQSLQVYGVLPVGGATLFQTVSSESQKLKYAQNLGVGWMIADVVGWANCNLKECFHFCYFEMILSKM